MDAKLETLKAQSWKDKGMAIIPEEYYEKVIAGCQARGWLDANYLDWSTKCNHQEMNPTEKKTINFTHYHVPVKMVVSRDAMTKYLQRKVPKTGGKRRFYIKSPKSKHHWVNMLIYNKTDKHTHENVWWSINQAKGVRAFLLEMDEEYKEGHEVETKAWLEGRNINKPKKAVPFGRGSDTDSDTDTVEYKTNNRYLNKFIA